MMRCRRSLFPGRRKIIRLTRSPATIIVFLKSGVPVLESNDNIVAANFGGKSDGVVSCLTGLLEAAKRDEIESVAVSFLYTDGSIGHLISSSESPFKLLGTIHALAHTYTKAIING